MQGERQEGGEGLGGEGWGEGRRGSGGWGEAHIHTEGGGESCTIGEACCS